MRMQAVILLCLSVNDFYEGSVFVVCMQTIKRSILCKHITCLIIFIIHKKSFAVPFYRGTVTIGHGPCQAGHSGDTISGAGLDP